MSFTWEVFHDPMGWLKAFAQSNMWLMSFTWDVSHEPMDWLKAFAPSNMWLMSSTWEVFHEPMASLNSERPRKSPPQWWKLQEIWRLHYIFPIICKNFTYTSIEPKHIFLIFLYEKPCDQHLDSRTRRADHNIHIRKFNHNIQFIFTKFTRTFFFCNLGYVSKSRQWTVGWAT